jgi:hypothetical protein
MRLPLAFVLSSAVLVLAGCVTSTPQSRISENRELYRSFPSAVQRKVSAGEVDIGFTEEMVSLALGKPGRKLTRADESGDAEVWIYYKRQPRVSLGFGVGSGGYSGVSTGVSMNTGNHAEDEVRRVIFHDGKVTAVENQVR